MPTHLVSGDTVVVGTVPVVATLSSFFVSPEATPEVLPGGDETMASHTLVFIALAFFFPEGLHYLIWQKGGGNHAETHPHVGICHGLGSRLWDGQGELQDTTVRATLRERQKVEPQQTGMTRERAPNKKGETSQKYIWIGLEDYTNIKRDWGSDNGER